LQEEVDPALFGTLLHESVRMIYDTLENPVEKEDIEKILKSPGKIRNAIDDSFRQNYFKDANKKPEGRNMVIREIIFTYAARILEKDKEYCPIRIQSLEDSYHMVIPVRSADRELSIKIGGKIDRIDYINGFFRVLDYKSGAGRMFFGSVDELFDGEQNNRNRAAFQTLLYAKLLKASGKDEESPIVPAVYLIREIFRQGFRYHFGIGTAGRNTPLWDYSGLDVDFSQKLIALTGNIFDPATAFTQTGQEEICRNCLYREICHR